MTTRRVRIYYFYIFICRYVAVLWVGELIMKSNQAPLIKAAISFHVLFFVCVTVSCLFQMFLCSSTPYSNKRFIIMPRINDATESRSGFLRFLETITLKLVSKFRLCWQKLWDLTVFYENKRHIYCMFIFSQREYDNLKTIQLSVCHLWKCRIWKVGK